MDLALRYAPFFDSSDSFVFLLHFQERPGDDLASESRKEKAMNIAKTMGFDIEPVSVNNSGITWDISADGNKLIQPLTSLKGLGEKAIEQI